MADKNQFRQTISVTVSKEQTGIIIAKLNTKFKINHMDPKSQADLDNHANQLNPNNEEYAGNDDHDYDNDNHSNQLNPNNDEYQGD